MRSKLEAQIKACLAYEVLQHPERWIGSPSTVSLRTFLLGAEMRASLRPKFSRARIWGALKSAGFGEPFVAGTGHSSLTITCFEALQLTHFSQAEGFELLRVKALERHRSRGVEEENIRPYAASGLRFDAGDFWDHVAARVPMYTGSWDSWALYCFMNGLDRGGDWLGLPPAPKLVAPFRALQRISKRGYGSTFGIFRHFFYLDSRALLKNVGLPRNPEPAT